MYKRAWAITDQLQTFPIWYVEYYIDYTAQWSGLKMNQTAVSQINSFLSHYLHFKCVPTNCQLAIEFLQVNIVSAEVNT